MVEEEMTPQNTNNSSKKKKDVWVKIADGLYEKQTKIVKKKKKKKKLPQSNPIFKGLGSSSRGPGNR